MTTSPHSSASCTGSKHWSGLTIKLVLVYKCLQGVAPSYFADDLCWMADLETQHRRRSASSLSLVVRRTRLSTYGDRAFPVAASISSLEQFATPRHVCTACFLWSSEDLSLGMEAGVLEANRKLGAQTPAWKFFIVPPFLQCSITLRALPIAGWHTKSWSSAYTKDVCLHSAIRWV